MSRMVLKHLKTMFEQEESDDEVLAVCKQQESGSEAIVSDRISSLPDSLLHHILSFLPTRQVVATSLLSKRWRPLWHSMPTFDFVQENTFATYPLYSLDFFIQFVDSVLLMADSKTIKKVRLCCGRFPVQHKGRRLEDKGVPLTRMNIWINTILYRKVEHLELCSDPIEHIVVPSSFFNSSTIRVLKLYWVKVSIPSFVKLPSLKVMHLENIQLPDYECLANLLSGCALLEELVMLIDDDEYDDVVKERRKDFTGNIEKLEHLVSANVQSFMITSKALTNVTCLRLNMDLPPAHGIPTFDNLTYLEILCLGDEFLYWMVECLRRCPKLEILVIDKFHDYPFGAEAIEPQTVDVPQCLSSHLKEFTFRGYEGQEWDFEIARYIMEKAKVLRTVSIIGYNRDANKAYSFLNMLASCPRGSEHCRLFFR